MIKYLKGNETTDHNIYKAFSIGFSDYIMKFDMSKNDFMAHFFGPEGNKREYTVVAFEQEEPIGIVLGGIKEHNGIKTLRCGALCIAPGQRGRGISDELMKMHQEMARSECCQQMMLEVIVGNDRAINFYKKKGYVKAYEILYYAYQGENYEISPNYDIKEITKNLVLEHLSEVYEEPLNWQNTFEYVEQLKDVFYYGTFSKNENLVGFITIDKQGKIFHLWTNPGHRFNGIATSLIGFSQRALELSSINISFICNAKILGFLYHRGFKPREFYQYEMYKWLLE